MAVWHTCIYYRGGSRRIYKAADHLGGSVRARGVDISHYQEGFKYDKKYDFVVQKATAGWSWTDPDFEVLLPEVMKAPIRGAYHYFLTGLDPIAQAAHFWATVKDHDYHFLAVDYESRNNNLNQAGEENLFRFWHKLQTLTNMPVLLYSNPYTLKDNLFPYNDFWKGVPLWVGHWNGQDPDTGEPETYGPNWTIWQYGSDTIDHNVFHGTLEEMQEWADLEQEEEMEAKKWYQSKTLLFFILTLIVLVAG